MTTPRSTRPGEAGAGSVPGQEGPGPQQPGPQQPDPGWDSHEPVAAVGQQTGAQSDAARSAEARGLDVARSAWPAFMAAGLGCLIVGLLLLFWPKATLTIVAVLIGVSLLVAGLLRLIEGFTAHDAAGSKRAANVVIGLLAGIVGLYCLKHPHFTIATLAIIVGIFWVMHGVADLVVSLFAGPFPGRGLTVIAGLFSLIAGLLVLFWPTISVTVLIAVIGIWLVVYGILMTVMAFRLRRGAASEPGPGQLAAA